MNYTKSHKGEATTVIIVVLVLALLTALGWIFWQNFIHKETTKTETDLIVVDKNKKTDEKENEKPAVTYVYSIDQWGLGAVKASNMDAISYKIETSNDFKNGIAYFTEEYYGSECTIAAIARYAPDEKVWSGAQRTNIAARDYQPSSPQDKDPKDWRKIGDYYYEYSRQTQALCGKNDADAKRQDASAGAVRTLFRELVEK